MQQSCDWAALESFKSNLWVLIVKKVVLSNQKTQMLHWSLATKLLKKAGSPTKECIPLCFQVRLVRIVPLSVSLVRSEGWRPESTGGGVVIRPSSKGRPLQECDGVRLLLSVVVIVCARRLMIA